MENIVLKNISFGYGEEQIIKDFSYEFKSGTSTCITGASGCGKTTLLHILAGLIEVQSGNITGLDVKKAVVFQDNRLCEDFSVMSNIFFATGRKYPKEKIKDFLSELGLSDVLNKKVKELSGGMKKRVAIARAVLYEPDLLLLDEAFEALDKERKESVIKAVMKAMKGKTVISITHDESEARLMNADILKMQ